MNIALPHIQDTLTFSSTDLTWVVSAYTLTFGGPLLLGARAGDILGRRRVFTTGTPLARTNTERTHRATDEKTAGGHT